ncbi:MAG: nucleotidyltransferase domain-containing protein [Methylococcales bacterium]
MQIRAKDFIETKESLIFAVLVEATEDGRHLCFLRYLRSKSGLVKLSTAQANRLLQSDHPEYLFHSIERDADVHGVLQHKIVRHHRPMQRLREVLGSTSRDPIEKKLVSVVSLLEAKGLSLEKIGVTGSLLLGAQNSGSDIDLVIYDRDEFENLRVIVRESIAERTLQALTEAQWQESYERRACSLTFDEYLWHERRKDNKASFAHTKIDFSLVVADSGRENRCWRKLKRAQITARVSDASRAFDHPARYRVEHAEILEIASYTPTYAGQASTGETVIACGIIEESDCGMRRLVVGSSREAPGESIQVVRSEA